MKMPDEIKNGLECAVTEVCKGKNACPYFNLVAGNCIRDSRRDALAYIQQLEARIPRWIPVEERLPEEHLVVLVYLSFGMTDTGVHNGSNWWNDLGIANNGNVTHWMPLPEPPTKGE